jgi:DNA-binding NtrC family response regulator
MPDAARMRKVLVVDDERVIADTLALIFTQRGHEARAVYSAEQALETVATWRPAVAVIDIILPNMNGIDLANALKTQDPAMEAVLITGQIVGNLVAESISQGGHKFDVMTKPVQVADLLENTERLLASVDPLQEN